MATAPYVYRFVPVGTASSWLTDFKEGRLGELTFVVELVEHVPTEEDAGRSRKSEKRSRLGKPTGACTQSPNNDGTTPEKNDDGSKRKGSMSDKEFYCYNDECDEGVVQGVKNPNLPGTWLCPFCDMPITCEDCGQPWTDDHECEDKEVTLNVKTSFSYTIYYTVNEEVQVTLPASYDYDEDQDERLWEAVQEEVSQRVLAADGDVTYFDSHEVNDRDHYDLEIHSVEES